MGFGLEVPLAQLGRERRGALEVDMRLVVCAGEPPRVRGQEHDPDALGRGTSVGKCREGRGGRRGGRDEQADVLPLPGSLPKRERPVEGLPGSRLEEAATPTYPD